MIIVIRPGETLWTPEGYHLLDVRGIAAIATEVTEIDIAAERYDAVLEIVKGNRAIQGLDPDTGLPLPPPETPSEVTPNG